MEEMIARWLREIITEMEKAKAHQNLYKMEQMTRLYRALINLRDKLL